MVCLRNISVDTLHKGDTDDDDDDNDNNNNNSFRADLGKIKIHNWTKLAMVREAWKRTVYLAIAHEDLLSQKKNKINKKNYDPIYNISSDSAPYIRQVFK